MTDKILEFIKAIKILLVIDGASVYLESNLPVIISTNETCKHAVMAFNKYDYFRSLMDEVRWTDSAAEMLTANFGRYWGMKYCVLIEARCMQLGVLVNKSDMDVLRRALNGLPWEIRRQMDRVMEQYKGTIGFEWDFDRNLLGMVFLLIQSLSMLTVTQCRTCSHPAQGHCCWIGGRQRKLTRFLFTMPDGLRP